MQQFVELLSANPLVFAFAVVAAVMILFSFFRSFFRFVMVIAAALVLYAALLHVSGGDPSETFRQVQNTVVRSVEHLAAMLSPLFDLLKFRKK
jgi:cell shape-determining protein MreC